MKFFITPILHDRRLDISKRENLINDTQSASFGVVGVLLSLEKKKSADFDKDLPYKKRIFHKLFQINKFINNFSSFFYYFSLFIPRNDYQNSAYITIIKFKIPFDFLQNEY